MVYDMKIRVNTYSDNAGTFVFRREEEVANVEETKNFYYVTGTDGIEREFAKDSLFGTSYKIEIIK